MKVFLSLFVMATLGLAACGGGGGDCKTVACMTSSNTYKLCGDVATTATYKFGSTSCSCTSTNTTECSSCSAELSSYCATPMGDGGTGGDLATGPDLSFDSSTCSIVGSFSGMVTGGMATLTSTGTSTSGSFTFTLTSMTPSATAYITGNYEYASGSLTMTNTSSSTTPSCMDMAEVLAVSWTNNCKTLMFTKTTDACTGRTTDLNGDTLSYTIIDMSSSF
jgi:hypothetical protein